MSALLSSLAARAASDAAAAGPYRDALLEAPLADVAERARYDATAREVLALHWESQGRLDVARLWRDEVAPWQGHGRRTKRREYIDSLTDTERAAMPAHVARWVAVGRSTQPADRPLFEAALACMHRLTYPDHPTPRGIWCPSPLVAVLAGPEIAVRLRSRGAVRGAVDDAVRGAVDGAVRGAVDGSWWRYFGGQFWVGGWWYGSPAFVGYLLDVCGLALPPRIELAARAYAAACSSACWWWPQRDFATVSERPHTLEWHDAAQTRLKRVAWDGWEVRR